MSEHVSSGRLRKRKVRRHQPWRDSLKAIMEPLSDLQTTTEIDVGYHLRTIRTTRGLSIRTLADMSGLNFNTLSLIENNKSSPSVSTLQQLAVALQVPITAFFDTENQKQEVVFQKKGQRPKAIFSHGTLEDLGTGLALGNGVPLVMTLEPGSSSGADVLVHTGQEFVYCLSGHLSYTVSDNKYDLEEGDSLIFQAHQTHRWENRGTVLASFLLILCPADDNDHSAEQHFKSEKDGL
jgi:transcriptional regulator with XRE-family HTH domain